MGFVLLLLSSTEGWSLSPCPGSPTSSGSTAGSWTDCFGTIIYSDGSKYGGEHKDDKRHGQGTYTFADGEKHVGDWKNGLPNGLGIHTYTDGRIEEGIFENGKFLDTKKPSPTN